MDNNGKKNKYKSKLHTNFDAPLPPEVDPPHINPIVWLLDTISYHANDSCFPQLLFPIGL